MISSKDTSPVEQSQAEKLATELIEQNEWLSFGAVSASVPLGDDGTSPPLTRISCGGQLVTRGIDTIHLTLSLQLDSSLSVRLAEAKKELQKTDGSEVAFRFGTSTLFSWNLQRVGTKLYPYVLRCGDVVLQLSNRKPDSRYPPASLTVGSVSCHGDLQDLYRRVKMWLFYHKSAVLDDKVSRIDICADYAIDIKSTGLIDQDKHVSYADNFALYSYRRKVTGLQVGTGDIVLRVYDKLQEMKQKRATEKEAFFFSKWGGVPYQITRVEFQLRRAAITSFFTKTSFRHVSRRLGDLWKYLTEDWFRACTKKVDRKNRNQDKSETSPFWLKVQEAYKEDEQLATSRIKKPKFVNVQALLDQAAGCVMSVVAALGIAGDDVFSVLHTSGQLITDKMNDIMQDAESFMKEFEIRQKRAVLSF